MYDVIIIGGGTAGLTAAIYLRRAEKTVLIIEKDTFGGQITFSPKVENIPGFISVSGNEFAEKLTEQAIEQGADFDIGKAVKIIDGEIKTVITDTCEYKSKSIIIATGAKHRNLGIENEEKFIGKGISFCAVCDGAFYKDKIVGVIGGGNSALQEAILLSDIAKKVYLIQNLDFLTGEKKLCNKAYSAENIEIITGHTVKSLIGETTLKAIEIRDEKNMISKKIILDGLFIAIGLIPQNEQFKDIIKLDDNGYAESNENCKTQKPGIFVAGDCRKKEIRQVITAASDGAIAALAACDYIDSLK